MWSYFSAIERVYNRLRSQNPVYLDTANGCDERMRRHWSWEVLTDESQCKVFRVGGFYRVYLGTGERSSQSCFRQVDRKIGSLVMIKDAILHGWPSKLVFIEGKVAVNTIFNTQVATYMLRYPHTCKKTRPRVADVCVRNLIDTNIETLPWSAFFAVNKVLLESSRPSHMIRTTCQKTALVLIEEWHPYHRQSSTNRLCWCHDAFTKYWL